MAILTRDALKVGVPYVSTPTFADSLLVVTKGVFTASTPAYVTYEMDCKMLRNFFHM